MGPARTPVFTLAFPAGRLGPIRGQIGQVDFAGADSGRFPIHRVDSPIAAKKIGYFIFAMDDRHGMEQNIDQVSVAPAQSSEPGISPVQPAGKEQSPPCAPDVVIGSKPHQERKRMLLKLSLGRSVKSRGPR